MKPSRDPFGFTAKSRPQGTDPIVVIAKPGQELRIVVPDDGGDGQTSGDASQSGSGDASKSGSGDASQSGSGDGKVQQPFGFSTLTRGYSPTPLTVIVRSGQEIRIMVPESGSVQSPSG